MEGEVYEKLSTLFRMYAETEMNVSQTTSRTVVELLGQALQVRSRASATVFLYAGSCFFLDGLTSPAS